MIKRYLYSKKGFITMSIIFTLFIVIVLPYISNLTEQMTNTRFSPDTGFFYSIDQFYEAMIIYGQSGRNFYILMRWTFDIIWPLVYLAFFISILAQLSFKCLKKENQIFILPITAVLFDLGENILASINVGIYPYQAVFLLRLLQVFSALKWIAIFLIVIRIIYLFTCIIIRKFNNKQ